MVNENIFVAEEETTEETPAPEATVAEAPEAPQEGGEETTEGGEEEAPAEETPAM